MSLSTLPRNFIISLTFLLIFGAHISTMAQTKNDSLEVVRAIQSIEYMQKRDADSAIALCYSTIDLANRVNQLKGRWLAEIYLGRNYFDVGIKDSAYAVLNRVLEKVENNQERLLEIEARLALAWCYQNDFNFEPTINQLIAADKLWKSDDSISYRFRILKRLGTTHKKMKNFDVALKYFQEIRDNYFAQLSNHEKYEIFMNEGNVYATQGKYDEAEKLYEDAFEMLKDEDVPSDIAKLTYNLGGVYFRQKKYEKAIENINFSLRENIKINRQSDIESCYRVLGAIEFSLKNYEKAESLYLKALGIAQKINKRKAILSNYENLYHCYWNHGYYFERIDYMDAALNYYQKYDLLKDTIYQQETANKILELEKQYETEKKNDEIKSLEKENENNAQLIKSQRSQKKYLILIIILTASILLIFIYFYYYYRKLNRLLETQQSRISRQRDLIAKQNIKLKQTMDTQNKLHSIIAHDLRSPLAAIANIVQLSEIYVADGQYHELEKVVKMLGQKNDQILELTDNLLNWARSQTGGVQPLFENVEYNQTLDVCMDLYQGVAKNKEINLVYEPNDTLVLWADKNMLRTLCRNLINNAIKFTPIGGSIKVKTVMKQNTAEICVQDTGVGISEDKLKRLFEVDPSKVSSGTEGEKSSGLGLLVCKEFVEAMSGKITVKSEIGKGSCFIIELPLSQS